MHFNQVHARQKQQFSLIFRATQDGCRPGLAHAFQQQADRHLGIVTEMPLEKPLVLGQLLEARRSVLADIGETVDQQHRMAMGQVVENFSSVH